MHIKKLEVGTLPDFLQNDIDALIDAIESGKELIDCEQSEVLGSIHMCQNANLISSYTAELLMDYYVKWGWMNG